jgi:hypothetical protein
MNKDELRELLHKEYKTENWKKVTEFVFPNVQYLQKPQAIPFNNEKVESFNQIGNVKLNDGKNLAMFEVKVSNNVNLSRNRVELRKLVENLIDQERNHGVLVIYEQGKEDYRFTFTAKSTEFSEEENDFVKTESDAKRFTYILGKNESCKTAANRFWELSTHKETATIKDVENAFSVERLNKEFFNKYKEFYEDFVQYITGKRFVKERGKWVEKKIGRARPIHKYVFDSDDKLARNFVKLLLGRLVFIQFLQKKGWMGVPADSKLWKNGDPDFLLNLYKNAKNKAEFHSKNLYPLFYKAFNTPNRPNDLFTLTGNRVPYLNGGLFENENLKTKEIDFPENYFENLLEFFGQYNFTIDENDPLDHEVGIDPEMLGHIFENLLEDNKDKGAFYTPKPIVQYMCQESLIQYLKTYLLEHNLWPIDELLAAQTDTNIQNFVRKKIASELLNEYDEHLARALKEVKICDPAIGSGAFPMGILNEIFFCMQVLHDTSPDSVGAVWEMEEWSPDIVKKNIIQHSIYGVDIEKGAVDIARLRFWLNLIVDENEPHPLPNLDYQIVFGDSLSQIQHDLFSDIYFKEINELKPKYFESSDPIEKKILKQKIDLLFKQITSGNKGFDFKVYFSDVFSNKGGFDIVIANPPYVEFKNLHKSIKSKIENNFQTLKGKYDLYIAFLELNKKLLSKNGHFCFINPTRFFQRDYGTEIRKFISVNYTPISIIDFSDKQIFETALTYTGIYLFKKKNIIDTQKHFYYWKANNNSIIQTANELFYNCSKNFTYSTRLISDLENKTWYFYDNLKLGIILKMQTDTTTLESITKGIFQGIATGKDSVFIVDDNIVNNLNLEKNLLNKFLKGKDIGPYSIGFKNKYLIYPYDSDGNVIDEKTLKSKYPNIYKYLISKKQELKGRDYFDKSQKKWYELWNQRNIGLFKSDKIITLDNARTNSFAFDNIGYFGSTTIYNVILKDKSGIDYYQLLGILNSNLMTFYHKENTIPQAGGFYRYQQIFIKDLPIKLGISKSFGELVKKILANIKNEDLFVKYKSKIDLFVYKHYGITYEEVKIIDPTFLLSKDQFNNTILS